MLHLASLMSDTGVSILSMVLIVMIAISKTESMSLNEHSSADEIDDANVERYERAVNKNHNKHHKHDRHKKKHRKAKNDTVTDSDKSNTTDSMYANKKIDVDQTAVVIGANMKSQKPVKRAHVKVTEVADDGSKTGVIVAVVLVLITVLGVGAAVFIVTEKMKVKKERKVVHSEETVRQKKRDKLQHQVDQHEGRLLNNLQRLHTLKHVNKLIPSKTLTADINVRLEDDSATDSSVMTFVAVGILIGHLLAILTIILCRCYKARSDTGSDGHKSVDVDGKGPKQEKRNEGVDSPHSNHSLKIRPLSTVKVNRATSTSQRNLLTSQAFLNSTPQTGEKQNQTSRLSLKPPLQVFRSTTDRISHLSMNSAPPMFRSAPDKMYKLSKLSIKSAPPTFGSIKDKTLGLSSNPPVKEFGSKQDQISFISMKSAPADLRSAPVKQKQISCLSIKSAPPALDSTQGQLSRLSTKSVPTAIRSTQEKQIQTSRLSLLPEMSNTQQNKAVKYKELVMSKTHSALLQEKQLASRLSLRSAPTVANHADNVIYAVKDTSTNPENIFSLTNKGMSRSGTSRHVELKPSSRLTSKSTNLNDPIVLVHEGATTGHGSGGLVHTGIRSILSVPENNNSMADDTGVLGVRPAPPYLTGIQQFRRD